MSSLEQNPPAASTPKSMADLYAGANEDKLEQKLKKIYGNQELNNKQKIEEMVKLYNDDVITGYKKAFQSVVHITSDHALNEFMSEYTAEQTKRGEIIQNKYQVLSQEYQSQAKSFKEKHEQVQADEVQKREGIISNFENHYASIKEQMKADHAALCDEEGVLLILNENEQLEEKYQDLLKEIAEKGELMDKQIKDKEQGTSNLQVTLKEQLSTHNEELAKQIDIYKNNTSIKKEEEAQLQKVLGEYKSKFNEFDKSTKQSRKTLSQYEKDIGAMNRKINQLQEQRKKVINSQMNSSSLADALDETPEPAKGGKNKKKRGKNVNNAQNVDHEKYAAEFNDKVKADIEKIKSDWESDKKAMADEKEKL